jgi:hypothetical protein
MTVENNKSSQPTNVLFYGRTLKEYVSMFDIELSAWQGCKILDCPAGPASFVEEARQQGLDVIGCDPSYTDAIPVMINHGNAGIDKTIEVCSQYSQYLSQQFYSSLEEMKGYATKALKIFAESYSVGSKENHYIQAALPNLPFRDRSFDLVLSGNFLFIYSKLINPNLEHLDYEFHRKAFLELLRVSKKEVRIFPVGNITGQPHEYVSQLLTELKTERIVAEIVPVQYQIFQTGNLMLRLTRL